MFDINTPMPVLYALNKVHEEVRNFNDLFYNFDFKDCETAYVYHVNNKVISIGKCWFVHRDVVEIPKRTRPLNPHLSADWIKKIDEAYFKADEACKYTLPYLQNIHSKFPELDKWDLYNCLPKQLTQSADPRTEAINRAIDTFRPLYDYLLQQEVIKGLLA